MQQGKVTSIILCSCPFYQDRCLYQTRIQHIGAKCSRFPYSMKSIMLQRWVMRLSKLRGAQIAVALWTNSCTSKICFATYWNENKTSCLSSQTRAKCMRMCAQDPIQTCSDSRRKQWQSLFLPLLLRPLSLQKMRLRIISVCKHLCQRPRKIV